MRAKTNRSAFSVLSVETTSNSKFSRPSHLRRLYYEELHSLHIQRKEELT